MSNSTAAARPTQVRWLILALLLVYSFMSWFNRVSMSVAYDEKIRHQVSISEEAIGGVNSAMLFAYMLCMTPGGWLADRDGARRALMLMGLGSALLVALTGAVGLLALPTAALVAAFFVVRVTFGVFTAPIYPASGRAIAHWLPARQRAWANGAVMAAALVGIAFCFPIFGGLLDHIPWPTAFLIAGVVTAQFGLLWTWYATDQPSQHSGVNAAELAVISADAAPVTESPDAGGWRALLKNRNLVLITLSYAAIGYFEYLFYFWMHYYFDEVLKLPKDESRMYSLIQSLAMAGGMFAGGWLADRMSRRWGRVRGRATVVVAGMLWGAVLLGAGLLAKQPEWIVLWFALAMAAVGSTEGPFWATALELGGRRGATAAGIFNTGGNAGGALAPWLTPVVSKALGWPAGIGLGAIVCLAGASLWLWIRPPETND